MVKYGQTAFSLTRGSRAGFDRIEGTGAGMVADTMGSLGAGKNVTIADPLTPKS